MSSNLILLDVDGVLLNWNQGFHRWMAENGHKIKNSDAAMIEDMYDMEIKDVRTCIRTFNETVHISTLEPINGAKEAVSVFKQNDFDIKCITSISLKESVIESRRQNLKTVFGDVFSDVFFLTTYGSKRDVLEKFSNTNAWWIEDNLKNAKDGADFGLKSILFSDKQSNDSRIISCNSWNTIVDIIMG